MTGREEIGRAEAELARVDNKATTLLTLTGVGLAVGVGAVVQQRPPLPVAIPTGVGLLLLAGAVWALLAAVRPDLNGGHGFVAYAKRIKPEDDEQQLLWLSTAIYDKYLRVRRAVDLLRAALLCAVAAAAVAVIF